MSGNFNPASGIRFSSTSAKLLSLFSLAILEGDGIVSRRLCSWWSSPTKNFGSGREDLLLQLKRVNYTLVIDKFLFIVMHFSRWIYDRGKGRVITGTFNFTDAFKFGVHTNTSCVIIIIGCNSEFQFRVMM